jgi:AraC-like DNA-binding protein
MSAIVKSYVGAPKGRGYESWREELCRDFCGIDIDPSDGEQIDCNLQLSLLSSLSLCTPSGTSAQFSRTREVLSDHCDDFVLVTATSGSLRVNQAGRDIELQRTQMCLTEMNVLGTVGLRNNRPFDTLRIPRRSLLSVCPTAEDRLSKAQGLNDPLRQMIAHYFALSAELAPQLDAVRQELMSQHIVDLVGLLLGTDSDRAEAARRRGYAAARFDLMRTSVLRQLGHGDLAIEKIAKTVGVSPRQAQRLFERSGTTFTEFVLEQRLLLARRLLLNPVNRWRKVEDIAHAAGFSDQSNFNRTFRRRFGATPSELRGK